MTALSLSRPPFADVPPLGRDEGLGGGLYGSVVTGYSSLLWVPCLLEPTCPALLVVIPKANIDPGTRPRVAGGRFVLSLGLSIRPDLKRVVRPNLCPWMVSRGTFDTLVCSASQKYGGSHKGVRAARQNWTVKGCFRCSCRLGALGCCGDLCRDRGHQSWAFGCIDRPLCMTGGTSYAPSYTLRTPGRRTGRERRLRSRFRMMSLDWGCGRF